MPLFHQQRNEDKSKELTKRKKYHVNNSKQGINFCSKEKKESKYIKDEIGNDTSSSKKSKFVVLSMTLQFSMNHKSHIHDPRE